MKMVENNSYFIKDSEAEVARLFEQDTMITRVLGGLLPEQADQAAFVEPMQRVLDVACGSGGWALHLAQTYPHLQVMGMDLDANMIDYAKTLAQLGRLENVSFSVMDVLLPLDYPDNFFDMINARWLSFALGRQSWQQVMAELFRVTRPGGFIRLTETEDVSVTTSPAFEKMSSLFLRACYLGGFSFSSRTSGLPPMLPRLLGQAGFQNLTKHALVLDWSAGEPVYGPMVQNFQCFFRLAEDFLMEAAEVGELEQLYQLYQDIQMELYAPDFCAFWTFYFFDAQKPRK